MHCRYFVRQSICTLLLYRTAATWLSMCLTDSIVLSPSTPPLSTPFYSHDRLTASQAWAASCSRSAPFLQRNFSIPPTIFAEAAWCGRIFSAGPFCRISLEHFQNVISNSRSVAELPPEWGDVSSFLPTKSMTDLTHLCRGRKNKNPPL